MLIRSNAFIKISSMTMSGVLSYQNRQKNVFGKLTGFILDNLQRIFRISCLSHEKKDITKNFFSTDSIPSLLNPVSSLPHGKQTNSLRRHKKIYRVFLTHCTIRRIHLSSVCWPLFLEALAVNDSWA